MSDSNEEFLRKKHEDAKTEHGPFDIATSSAKHALDEESRRNVHDAQMAAIHQVDTLSRQTNKLTDIGGKASRPKPKGRKKDVTDDPPPNRFWRYVALIALGVVGYNVFIASPERSPSQNVEPSPSQVAPAPKPIPQADFTELGALQRIALPPEAERGRKYLPASVRNIVVTYGCAEVGGDGNSCKTGTNYIAAHSLSDGRRLYSIRLSGYHSSPWYEPAFGGNYAAAGSWDEISVYDLRNGSRVATFPVADSPSTITIDPNNPQLVYFLNTDSKEWLVVARNWDTKKELLRVTLPGSGMPFVRFSGDGNLLLISGPGKKRYIFDLFSQDKLLEEPADDDYLGYAMGSSSILMISGGPWKFQAGWERAEVAYGDASLLREAAHHDGAYTPVCDRGDGKSVFVFVNGASDTPDRIEIFNPLTLKHLGGFEVRGRPEDFLWVRCTGSSADGKILFLSGSSRNDSALFRVNAHSSEPLTHQQP